MVINMESIKELYKIGPGPSSSHTIGPEKACKYILSTYQNIDNIVVTLYGSLALTGKGHLTDKIIDKTFENVKHEIIFNYESTTKDNVMNFDITFIDLHHENVKIISVGGGSIDIVGNEKEAPKKAYPFKSFSHIKEYCSRYKVNLCDVVFKYEDDDIKDYLAHVYEIMEESIENGLKADGYLPGSLHVARKAKKLYETANDPETEKIRLVSSYAFAVSEENATGKTIVTAPTCGASGVLPAVLKYYKDKNNLSIDKIIEALAVAGLIGNVIKLNAYISGALAGCQAEIGSACSMAAAAISYLEGLGIDEIEYAAEIALEHHLGLTCDPIDGLVQIPCIERNAVAALRAIDAACLASFLNGTRRVSFDTVVKTMKETGDDINRAYCETSIGGLAKNFKGE